MIEVLRTTDAVRLSYALALLRDADCDPFVADQYMAASEAYISAFPRRILVPEEQERRARVALLALDRPPPPDGWPDEAGTD